MHKEKGFVKEERIRAAMRVFFRNCTKRGRLGLVDFPIYNDFYMDGII